MGNCSASCVPNDWVVGIPGHPGNPWLRRGQGEAGAGADQGAMDSTGVAAAIGAWEGGYGSVDESEGVVGRVMFVCLRCLFLLYFSVFLYISLYFSVFLCIFLYLFVSPFFFFGGGGSL